MTSKEDEPQNEAEEAACQKHFNEGGLEGSSFLAGYRERDAEIDRLRGVIAAIFNRLPSSGDFSEPQVVSGMLRDIFDLALNGLGSDSPAAKYRLGVEHELARAKELIEKQKEHLDGRLERIGVYVTELAESRATVAILSEALKDIADEVEYPDACIAGDQLCKYHRLLSSLPESARRYQEDHERMRVALERIAKLDKFELIGGDDFASQRVAYAAGAHNAFCDATELAQAALDGCRRSEEKR